MCVGYFNIVYYTLSKLFPPWRDIPCKRFVHAITRMNRFARKYEPYRFYYYYRKGCYCWHYRRCRKRCHRQLTQTHLLPTTLVGCIGRPMDTHEYAVYALYVYMHVCALAVARGEMFSTRLPKYHWVCLQSETGSKENLLYVNVIWGGGGESIQ